MKERPLIVLRVENLNVQLAGSVHTLRRNIPRILREIERFTPDVIGIELTDPGRLTGAQDVDTVSRKYRDRLLCLDRPLDVTMTRYLCDTPAGTFLKECLVKYAWLPFNQASIFAYNYLPGLYRALFGEDFLSFGWSKEDARRYIFERDEYMAGRLLSFLRDRRCQGYRDRCLVLVGRRHVAGIAAILEAYAVTGDIGSYYAGGRMLDVFNEKSLEEPYESPGSVAERRFVINRAVASLVSTLFLPAYMLALFLIIIACAGFAILALSKILAYMQY